MENFTLPKPLPIFQHGRPIRKIMLMKDIDWSFNNITEFELEKDEISLMYLDTELSKLIILYEGGILEAVNLLKFARFKFEFVDEDVIK